jgi:hypothetical protein
LDNIAYKLENRLLRQVKGIEHKGDKEEWTDQSGLKEINRVTGID